MLAGACAGEDDRSQEALPCVLESAERCGPAWAEVTRAVDGDTVELAGGQRVRLLCVDTPELSATPPECFASEAQQLTASLLVGREVALEYDSVCSDRYGRLLAYVCVDGRLVNQLLLERGYGRLLVIEPNTARAAELAAAAQAAEAADRGLWGACP